MENSKRLIDHAASEAARFSEAARASGLGGFETHTFQKSVERVHCFYEWTLGYDGEQIWVGDDVAQISSLFASLTLEFRAFRTSLEKRYQESGLERSTSGASLTESWEQLLGECLRLEHRLTVLLSLLLINRPHVELSKYALFEKVRDTAMQAEEGGDAHARNAFVRSLLAGTSAAFVVTTLYLAAEKVYRDSRKTNDLAELAPFGAPAEHVERTFLQWLVWVGDRMDNAFFETLDFVAIFCVSVAISLAARETRLEMRTWRLREDATVAPAGTYLYVGLLAYVPSVLVFLMLRFFMLNVIQPLRAGVEPLEPTSLSAFPGYLPEIVAAPMTAFVCVWFVCGYLDQRLWRRRAFAPNALLFALACGGINLVQKMVREDGLSTGHGSLRRAARAAARVRGPVHRVRSSLPE